MSETNTSTPKLNIGLPEGVDIENVRSRAAVMIANGTHPLQAEKLAIDAEQAQIHRDREFAKLQEGRKKPASPTEEDEEPAKKKGGK